jgi:hypothetical protein
MSDENHAFVQSQIADGRLYLSRKVYSPRQCEDTEDTKIENFEQKLDVEALEKSFLGQDATQDHVSHAPISLHELGSILVKFPLDILKSLYILDFSYCLLCDDDLISLCSFVECLPKCNMVCLRGCPTLGLGPLQPLIHLLSLAQVDIVDISDTRYAGLLRFDLYEYLACEKPSTFQKLIFLDDRAELDSQLWHVMVPSSLHSTVELLHANYFTCQSQNLRVRSLFLSGPKFTCFCLKLLIFRE